MNAEQKAAIFDVSTGNIDDTAFCTLYAIAPEDLRAETARLLELAASTRDAEAVELALLLGSHFQTLDGTINLIHELVGQAWHLSHEEMIRLLQHWQDPTSVSPLRQAIRLKPELDYLDYDDYGAYYKKCLWALAAIGTPAAISVLEDCAASGNRVLREQAAYRLGKLDSRRR